MTVIYEPMVGTNGRGETVDTMIDRIYSEEVVIVNGEPIKNKVGIGYCERKPGANVTLHAIVPDGIRKEIRTALAYRDAEMEGTSGTIDDLAKRYAARKIMDVSYLMEETTNE